MLKKEIREFFLEKRKALQPVESANLSLSIKKQFDDFLPPNIKTVHIFLPIPGQSEIDTWPIIHGLWSNNIRTSVPLMEPDNRSMRHIIINHKSEIVLNKWQIPEPVLGDDLDINEIDVVVMPLLACDMQGHRVGYGKGIYDFFLAKLPIEVPKIGLSFFHPIDRIHDISPWDIALDYCICPDLVFKF